MRIILSLIFNALAIWLSAYILKGVYVDGFLAAILTGVVLSIANLIIKPILTIITLPITVLTLGLFLLVINAIVLLLVDYLVPGFKIDGFLWAIVLSVVLSIINYILGLIV